MRVLIAETEQQIARERAEQLCMDGHQAAVALTAQAAGMRLAELPDVLVLCELDSPVQTITLLRAVRAGEIPRSDSRVPVLLVGADGDDDAIRYMGYPFESGSLAGCLWPAETIRAPMRSCWRGSPARRRAWTTWSGCGARMGSAAGGA
jgi:CheY-like chemotaxis protein